MTDAFKQVSSIKNMNFETKHLPAKLDYLAPDSSEIRLLPSMNGGGLCHCTLPPGHTSIAVMHKTVEEIWYFTQGCGHVWRKLGDQEQETDVQFGVCLTIPVGTHFQFRNVGEEPLCFVIATMPPWPGKQEAIRVTDHWPASLQSPQTVGATEINRKLLTKLIKQAVPFGEHLGPYAGVSWRKLEEYNSYEEPGSNFKMVTADMTLTQLYAGLAVYCRDLDRHLKQHPRNDANLFQEVVLAVNEEERPHYQETAFPYNDPKFPWKSDLSKFPSGLTEAAAAGQPDFEWLKSADIRHEWTVKAGKRLLLKFGGKFKIVICGKDGPYEQFEKGLVGQAALPTTIAAQILAVGTSAATLWYPLAVYLGILIVKTGLKTYCEPDAKLIASSRSKSSSVPKRKQGRPEPKIINPKKG